MTPLAAIVGPTAAGKSDLALAVARELPVEIIVADSRQVYRGMDIGTAKPDAAARAAVPHHLLDVVDPDQPFTVVDWLAAARPLVPAIAARGRLPLVVGGTGLYVSALVDGYRLEEQPWSPDTRRLLAEELETQGLAALAARLAELDPPAAARTDLRNPRRVLRALERALAGGGAATEPTTSPWPGPLAMVGISMPRPALHARIDARAAWMFSHGLLEEVSGLMVRGYGPELPPMTGHGYREAALVLSGEWSVAQAIEVTARHTRQYAKRQMTWFGRDPRISWLAADTGKGDVVPRALELLRGISGG